MACHLELISVVSSDASKANVMVQIQELMLVSQLDILMVRMLALTWVNDLESLKANMMENWLVDSLGYPLESRWAGLMDAGLDYLMVYQSVHYLVLLKVMQSETLMVASMDTLWAWLMVVPWEMNLDHMMVAYWGISLVYQKVHN